MTISPLIPRFVVVVLLYLLRDAGIGKPRKPSGLTIISAKYIAMYIGIITRFYFFVAVK